MAFPTAGLVADTSTHTIGSSTWKWNGYAWDRQAAAVSGDTHGHTGDAVVDSFNGLTGDVTTDALVLAVAGISSSGGATFADPIFVPTTFNLKNSNGDTVFDVATRNINIGDVDSAGNATDINIRDSHNAIYLNAPSQIRLNAPDVYIESGGHLGALNDTNTHIHFASNDVKNFLAGGVTYATGTPSNLSAPLGITLGPLGISFADGTNMTTASSGSGGGVTQSIGFVIDGNGSPITVGDKLDALKQVPINSYLLNTSAYVQDGVTANTNEISFSIQKISSIPKLSSAITGTTLDLGVTASVEQGGFTFMGGNGYTIYFHELDDVSSATGSEISADDWLYPSVLGNSGDINKLQIFLTVVPT